MGGNLSPAYNYNAVPSGSPYGLQGYPSTQNPTPQRGGSNVLNQMYSNSQSPVDPMFGYMPAASAGGLRTILGLTTTDAQPLSLHSFVANTLPPLLSGISAFAVQHYFDPYRATNFPAQASYTYNPVIPSYSDSGSNYSSAYSGAQNNGLGYGNSGYDTPSIMPYTSTAAPDNALEVNLRARNAVIAGNNIAGSSTWNVQTVQDFLATANNILGSLGANINAGGNANLSNNMINYGAAMPMYTAMPAYGPTPYQMPAYQSPIHLPVQNYANGGTYGGYGFA